MGQSHDAAVDVVSFKPVGEEAQTLKVDKRDGLTYWTPNGVGSKSIISPQEHAAIKALDETLREKAQWRAATCCWHNCDAAPITWALEVKFDLHHADESLDRIGTDSTAELSHGELPGFCWKHIADKPAELAQLIFNNLPAAKYGWRPTRWIIKYTDGSTTAGDVQEIISPMLPRMTVVEEYIQNPNAKEIIEEET